MSAAMTPTDNGFRESLLNMLEFIFVCGKLFIEFQLIHAAPPFKAEKINQSFVSITQISSKS